MIQSVRCSHYAGLRPFTSCLLLHPVWYYSLKSDYHCPWWEHQGLCQGTPGLPKASTPHRGGAWWATLCSQGLRAALLMQFSSGSISFRFLSSATKSLKAGSSSPFYSSALQPWTLIPSLKAERNTVRMFLSYIPSPAVRPSRLLLPSWVLKQQFHPMSISVG